MNQLTVRSLEHRHLYLSLEGLCYPLPKKLLLLKSKIKATPKRKKILLFTKIHYIRGLCKYPKILIHCNLENNRGAWTGFPVSSCSLPLHPSLWCMFPVTSFWHLLSDLTEHREKRQNVFSDNANHSALVPWDLGNNDAYAQEIKIPNIESMYNIAINH